jgi:hypothetical protein
LTEPQGAPVDDDDYHLFVEEEGVVVSSEDLFDLPTAARSLPGMYPVDSAAAMDEFTEAEAEPEVARSIRWRTPVALAAAGLLSFAVMGAVLRMRSPPSDEIAASPPEVEVSVPLIAAPVVEPTVEPVVERVPVPKAPVHAPVLPAIQRNGHDRLHDIEGALAAGRRDFARI